MAEIMSQREIDALLAATIGTEPEQGVETKVSEESPTKPKTYGRTKVEGGLRFPTMYRSPIVDSSQVTLTTDKGVYDLAQSSGYQGKVVVLDLNKILKEKAPKY